MTVIFKNTPLIENQKLAESLGIQKLYFKLDNLQESKSFKTRGLGYCIQQALLKNKKITQIVSSSGGNAGFAATLIAKKLGLEIKVFVPKTTSVETQKLLTENGAEVVVIGDVWDETHKEAVNFLNCLEPGTGFLVHPFDHEDIWQGHSSIVSEIEAEIGLPDVLVASVGGGGLLCVLATETEGAASFAAAVKADKLVTIDSINSIAKSLGAKTVAKGTLRLREEYGKDMVAPVVVTDEMAVKSVEAFHNDYGYYVEPACGAALAVAYIPGVLETAVRNLNSESVVVIEVCGGFQVNEFLLNEWKKDLGIK